MNNSADRVAVIDLGSNSVRISIAEVSCDAAKLVYAEKSRVKLSENMNNDMILKEPAKERTVSVLKDYKSMIEKFGCSAVFAVATAAVRKAANGGEFIKKVFDETGIDIKIISGEQEAKYDFYGVKTTLKISDFVIMDIGGGSTEIIGAKGGRLCNFVSIPFGSRSITEQWLKDETEENKKNAEKKVFEEIKKVEWLGEFCGVPVVGLGGCLKAVGKVEAEKCGARLKNNFHVPFESIEKLYSHVKQISVSERVKIKGIGESRGDIILGGLMPFMSVAKIISPHELIVSGGGIRDGILYEYMADKKQ